jgi:hypothetical protein
MKIYAKREDNGERILVAIQCDDCDKEIKPNPAISESGWMIQGSIRCGKKEYENHYCPECWDIREYRSR